MKHSLANNPLRRLFLFGPKHLADYIRYGYFNKPFRLTVDITSRCNLHCKTCFWQKEKEADELSDREWENRIDQALNENPSIIQAVWFGGEPMLRFNLIKKLSKKFYSNHVYTNGTIPLASLPRTKYSVSIDGTKYYHEKQRGPTYDLIKTTLKKSKVKSFDIIFLISKVNYKAIEAFLRAWSRPKKVNRIIFSFYSPDNARVKDPDWIDEKKKGILIKKIKKLTKHYPKARESAQQLEYLSPAEIKATQQSCWKNQRNSGVYLDSKGKEKYAQTALGFGIKVPCPCKFTDCFRCASFLVARQRYMAENRLLHLSRVFKRLIS